MWEAGMKEKVKTHKKLNRTLLNEIKQHRMQIFQGTLIQHYKNKQRTFLLPVALLIHGA